MKHLDNWNAEHRGHLIRKETGGWSGTYNPNTTRPYAILKPDGDRMLTAAGHTRTFGSRASAAAAIDKTIDPVKAHAEMVAEYEKSIERNVTIRVTDDENMLANIWTRAWAEEHVNRFYKADIHADGWAHISNAKFPTHAYRKVIA